ncbi:outer membrane protein assembly factor BamB family protein [Halogeometricum borinquense]|uniref:outer membrane protein assembly factor BamB family protein n=1 Tax=Halogeometricum borinquense TaxID=60847 RepID=UPI0030B81F72
MADSKRERGTDPTRRSRGGHHSPVEASNAHAVRAVCRFRFPPIVGGDSVFYTTGTQVVADGKHSWQIDKSGDGLSPTLHGGTLYTQIVEGLLALAPRDGTERWRLDSVESPGPQAPGPTVVDETLVAATRTDIVGIDLTTRETWRTSHNAMRITGLAAGERGIVSAGIADDGAVVSGYALDGTKRWEKQIPPSDIGSDLFVCLSGHDICVLTDKGRLDALDAEDGTRQWQANLSSGIVGRPALADGLFLVPASENRTAVHAYDVQQGDAAWTQSVPHRSFSLTVVGDVVVVPLDGLENRTMVLSLADGTVEAEYQYEHELFANYAVTSEANITHLE